ncbi:MAG TPA: M36 family metallopeptidase [Vicinamibacterales bacterium]|nr:M36 family metallopeptidase [Vicinamibacterales bacterium]
MTMYTFRRALLVLSAVFILAADANAQARFEHPEARIHRLENLGLLTGPSNDSARTIVIRALRERGVADSVLNSLVVVSDARNAATGVRDVRFEQRVAGLWVYDTYVRAALTASGEVIQIIDATVAVPRAVPGSRASAQQALLAALRHLHPEFPGTPAARGQSGNATTFAGGPFFHSDPMVTRVAIPMTDGSLRAGFLVETWTERRNLLNHTLVDGDGAVVNVESRTSQDSYNVFRVSPNVAPQEIVAGPAPAPDAPSPSGWLFGGTQNSLNIAGNNVRAYLDTDANNQPDAGSTAVADGNFLATADLSQSPSIVENKKVAAQNLFYLNNVLHDMLYRYGFTEAEGNFQENNFGKGGRGSDSVNAEAQDGGGTDNANFATPRDGQNPRMQMFLWTGAGGTHSVVVNVPASIAGTYQAMGADFGPTLDTTGITGNVTLVNDGVGTTTDACEALAAGSLSGQIALIDRGTCAFTVKVKNAQNAGATAAIVANNQATGILVMGGTDATITIGSVFISQEDGVTLRSVTGVNATVKLADVQPLQIDGDLDSDIVYHEYGHGLTWRMIGRMDGPLAGAIGEGMSDVLAVVINDDDRVAEYSFSNPIGIRSAPYTNYGRTYGDIAGTGVHFDGEVYGAIGWRLWELFKAEGLTKDALLSYLVAGMTFTPAQPKFEHMRDGILSAAAGSGHECKVWQAFAKYGVGVGASATVRGSRITIVESFAVPAGCPAP